METFQEHISYLQKAAAKFRIDLVEMLHKAQSGHLGGSLSVVEMLVVLYYGQLPGGSVMNYDIEKPGWEGQDYMVLSKAHAAPAWYTVLGNAGFFDTQEFQYFRQLNALLQAYPTKKIPGVMIGGAGSGSGLAAAVGLAMALKMDKQPNRVFCVVGDGELQQGRVWEAALVAAHHKLDNLTLLVDYNGLQMDGSIRGIIGIDPLIDKFESFGWKAIPVTDGHNVEELLVAMEKALETQRKPSVLIARTIKGKGIPFVENKSSYHAEVLSDEEMAEALPRLQQDFTNLLPQ